MSATDGPYAPGANARFESDNRQFVGDYTNPILKPQAAEAVRKQGEIELSGVSAPIPSNQCWPEPVPYIFLISECRCSSGRARSRPFITRLTRSPPYTSPKPSHHTSPHP